MAGMACVKSPQGKGLCLGSTVNEVLAGATELAPNENNPGVRDFDLNGDGFADVGLETSNRRFRVDSQYNAADGAYELTWYATSKPVSAQAVADRSGTIWYVEERDGAESHAVFSEDGGRTVQERTLQLSIF
jgi:hypothetical protein